MSAFLRQNRFLVIVAMKPSPSCNDIYEVIHEIKMKMNLFIFFNVVSSGGLFIEHTTQLWFICLKIPLKKSQTFSQPSSTSNPAKKFAFVKILISAVTTVKNLSKEQAENMTRFPRLSQISTPFPIDGSQFDLKFCNNSL
uniref:Uncharacterized protein n=1 Tax=Glossina brevipalpis TaxID=37001 RepID=A0A1A9WXI6_9MUSC